MIVACVRINSTARCVLNGHVEPVSRALGHNGTDGQLVAGFNDRVSLVTIPNMNRRLPERVSVLSEDIRVRPIAFDCVNGDYEDVSPFFDRH